MGRLSQLSQLVVGAPVALPDELRREFPELAAARLREGGIAPRIAGWLLGQPSVAAITLWRTIFLGTGVTPGADLLLHELRHVEQFKTRKSFPLHYIWQSLRHGYHHNCYEIDARNYASRRLAESAGTRATKEG